MVRVPATHKPTIRCWTALTWERTFRFKSTSRKRVDNVKLSRLSMAQQANNQRQFECLPVYFHILQLVLCSGTQARNSRPHCLLIYKLINPGILRQLVVQLCLVASVGRLCVAHLFAKQQPLCCDLLSHQIEARNDCLGLQTHCWANAELQTVIVAVNLE